MRNDAPSGREIAEKAKTIKFDNSKDFVGEKNGKKMHFRGVDLNHLTSLDDLENGQVIGVIDNELAGDETPLPAGKHNLFLSKVDGKWRLHAESGGQVVAEAIRVSVTEHKMSDRKKPEPQFSPEGWCVCVCLVPFWCCCLLSVCWCF